MCLNMWPRFTIICSHGEIGLQVFVDEPTGLSTKSLRFSVEIRTSCRYL